MPVYRTPDGRIVEEKTEVTPPGVPPATADSRRGTTRTDETTMKRDSGGRPPVEPPVRSGSRHTDTTVMHRPGSGAGTAGTARGQDDEKTRLGGSIPRDGTQKGEEVDPVTGWLVVIDGPGKGNDVRIGNGRNAVGRDKSNRVALPFDDTQISRKKHLWIAYSHQHQTFSITPGDDSPNLADLNGEPIDARLPLPDGATITVGKTTLRFVAFCGERFKWDDSDAG